MEHDDTDSTTDDEGMCWRRRDEVSARVTDGGSEETPTPDGGREPPGDIADDWSFPDKGSDTEDSGEGGDGDDAPDQGSTASPAGEDSTNDLLDIVGDRLVGGEDWELEVEIDGVELSYHEYRRLDSLTGGTLSERVSNAHLTRTDPTDRSTSPEDPGSTESADEGPEDADPLSSSSSSGDADAAAPDPLPPLERELDAFRSELASNEGGEDPSASEAGTGDVTKGEATAGATAEEPTGESSTSESEVGNDQEAGDRFREDQASSGRSTDQPFEVDAALTRIEDQLGDLHGLMEELTEVLMEDSPSTGSWPAGADIPQSAGQFTVETNARLLGDVLHTLESVTDVLDRQDVTDTELRAALEEVQDELEDHAERLEDLEANAGGRAVPSEAVEGNGLAAEVEAIVNSLPDQTVEIDDEELTITEAIRELAMQLDRLGGPAVGEMPDDIDEELTALRSDVETIKQTLDMVSAEEEKARETDDIRREVRELERENKAIKELIEGLHQRI